MPVEIEDLEFALKARLIISWITAYGSLFIIGGLHTASMLFGLVVGWWLIPISFLPLVLLMWNGMVTAEVRYLLGWHEENHG